MAGIFGMWLFSRCRHHQHIMIRSSTQPEHIHSAVALLLLLSNNTIYKIKMKNQISKCWCNIDLMTKSCHCDQMKYHQRCRKHRAIGCLHCWHYSHCWHGWHCWHVWHCWHGHWGRQVSKIQNNPPSPVRDVADQTLEYSVRTVSLWNWPGWCLLRKMNEKSLWNFHKAAQIARSLSPLQTW